MYIIFSFHYFLFNNNFLLDILVLGMGDDTVLDMKLMKELKRRGLNVEALPTDKACSTFNFLNAEFRYVAAALIPPEFIRTTSQDLFEDRSSLESLKTSDVFQKIEESDSIDDDPKAQELFRQIGFLKEDEPKK